MLKMHKYNSACLYHLHILVWVSDNGPIHKIQRVQCTITSDYLCHAIQITYIKLWHHICECVRKNNIPVLSMALDSRYEPSGERSQEVQHTCVVHGVGQQVWAVRWEVSGSTTYLCCPWRWTAGMSRQVRGACPSPCPRGPAFCTAHRSSVDPTPGGHIVIILFQTFIN